MVCAWMGKKSSTDLQEIVFKWNPFKFKTDRKNKVKNCEAVSVFILFRRTYVLGESLTNQIKFYPHPVFLRSKFKLVNI